MPTNASILADYASGIGTQGTTLTIDGDLKRVGIGTTLPTSTLDVNGDVNVTGVVTATSFYGNVIGDISGNADTATYASTAGIATYADVAGIATYATTAGIATYATTAGIATYATTAGIATVAENLTGNPSISVTDITATGNVSIAGTLTYEDVTNVDSIGIITARNGIDVTGNVDLGDNDKINLGDLPDMEIYHDGGNSYIREIGAGQLYIESAGTVAIRDTNGVTVNASFSDGTNGQQLYYQGTLKFLTTADGIAVNTNVGLGITAGDPDQVIADFRTQNSNASILKIVEGRDVDGTDWTSAYTRIQKTIDVTDQAYIQFNGDGNTYGMEFGTQGDEKFAVFKKDAEVELYYDNSKKLETTTTGVTVTGNVLPDGNGTRDLGATGTRWANLYTSDLDLSNEAKGGNDVDGTWGAYTIQEGENDLFLINRRNGKTYKFVLQEVS